MSSQRCVYLWANAVYCQARLEEERRCLGADADWKKELVGLSDGYSEPSRASASCCWTCYGAAGRRGPNRSSATGRWACGRPCARSCPQVRIQRCWVHRTRNVLDKLQQIWMAESVEAAGQAREHFAAAYQAKYYKAVEYLLKDREELLALYSYPAEHWRHLRTTNPGESVFATVRLRTVKTCGCLSRKTAFAMVLQLVLSAQQKWRRLNGHQRLAQLIKGVQFRDGTKKINAPPKSAITNSWA